MPLISFPSVFTFLCPSPHNWLAWEFSSDHIFSDSSCYEAVIELSPAATSPNLPFEMLYCSHLSLAHRCTVCTHRHTHPHTHTGLTPDIGLIWYISIITARVNLELTPQVLNILSQEIIWGTMCFRYNIFPLGISAKCVIHVNFVHFIFTVTKLMWYKLI